MRMKIIPILFIIICLLGCSGNSVEEAFRKKYPNKDYEILFVNNIEETTFALFKVPIDGDKSGIGLALFTGDNKHGWSMPDSVSKFTDSEVIIDSKLLKSDASSGIYILYGAINNPRIERLEVIDKNGARINGQIVSTSWKRVWYCAAAIDELRIDFYDKAGNLVYRVPKS